MKFWNYFHHPKAALVVLRVTLALLMLLHGWPLDLGTWDPLAAQLAVHFTVLRFDRRGFGQSEGLPDIHRNVDDLCAVLDAAGEAGSQVASVAGNVIVRQRPGTAKGVLFMSLEDETGISNVVVLPEVFEQQRREILTHAWVLVEGKMQNVDSVIYIQAERVVGLGDPLRIGVGSHDFH